MSEIILTYDMDKSISICEHIGVCGYAEALEGIKRYYAGPMTKYAITDFTQADVSAVSGDEITRLAHYMREVSVKRAPYSYDLIIVPGLLHFGLSRIYTTYLQYSAKNDADLKTEVFHTRKDALHWIDAHKIQNPEK